MEFIGREREFSVLEREYRRESSFVVVYGRRRVGKTTLIRKFLEGKAGFYYLATEEPEQMSMDRLSSMIGRVTGNPIFSNAHFDDWMDIFRAFADIKTEEKKILVIDEFPYLVKMNSAFPSIMQKAWDEVLKDSNTMLILSGSLVSMMRKHTLEASSPLYGRRTAQINLAPLSFSLIYKHCHDTFENAVLRYSLTGGVPKYEEILQPYNDFSDMLKNEFLDTSGYFFEEPYFMFKDEVNTPVTYFGILQSIANGNHKSGDIASSFNASGSALTPYMTVLRDMNVVERRAPITERKPELSKKGLYYIQDNFLRFWFRYIFPWKGELEMHFSDYVLSLIEKDFVSGYLAFCYEDISADIFCTLCKEGKICFTPSRIGRYWINNRKQDLEFDVVAVDSISHKLFVGECKWFHKPVDMSVLEKLEEKVDAAVELHSAYPGWQVLYGLFSGSGFTDELIRLSDDRDDLLLIDKDHVL